ncbi:SOS-response repressor and protease LexA [Vibrio sp. JCM 19053]|nr:SOS-response repressor and protease LexA [Vibrio sp. JCM 19053]
MKPLTPRQQQVFDLIKSKIDDTGMPPIVQRLRVSLASALRMPQRNT